MPSLVQLKHRINDLFKGKSSDFSEFFDTYKNDLKDTLSALSLCYLNGEIDYDFVKSVLMKFISYLSINDGNLHDYRDQLQELYLVILTFDYGKEAHKKQIIVADFTRFIMGDLVKQKTLSIENMLYIIFKITYNESVFLCFDKATIPLLLNFVNQFFSDGSNEIAANYDIIEEAFNARSVSDLGFYGLELYYNFIERFSDRASIVSLITLLEQACLNLKEHKTRASSIILFCFTMLSNSDNSEHASSIVHLLETRIIPIVLSCDSNLLDDVLSFYCRFKVSSANSLDELQASHPLINHLIRGHLAPELKAKIVFFLLASNSLSSAAKENLGLDRSLSEGLFNFVTSAQYGDMGGKQCTKLFIQWLFLLFLTSGDNKPLFRFSPETFKKMGVYRESLLQALCYALADIEHNIYIKKFPADNDKYKKMLKEGRAVYGEKIASLNEQKLYLLLDESFERLGEQSYSELEQLFYFPFSENPTSFVMILAKHAFFSTLFYALRSAVIPPSFAAFLGSKKIIRDGVFVQIQAYLKQRQAAESRSFLVNNLFDIKGSLYPFLAHSKDKIEYFKTCLSMKNEELAKSKAEALTETTSTSTEAPYQELSADASDSSPVFLQPGDSEEWSDFEDETEHETLPALPASTQQYHILGLQNNCCVNLAIPEMLFAITYFARKESTQDGVAEPQMDSVEKNYNILKDVFSNYYEVSAETCTWVILNELLTQTINHNLLVAQIILGPVLRHFMQRNCSTDESFQVIYQLQQDGRYYSLNMANTSYYLYYHLGISIVSHERVGSDEVADQEKMYRASNGFATVNVYNTSEEQHWQRGTTAFALVDRESITKDYASSLNYFDDVSAQDNIVRVEESMHKFKREVNKSYQELLNPVRISQHSATVFERSGLPPNGIAVDNSSQQSPVV